MSSVVDAEAQRAIAVAVVSASALALAGAVDGNLTVVALAMLLSAALASASPTGALAAVAATLSWFHQPISVGSGEFALSELLLVSAAAGIASRQCWLVATRRMAIGGAAKVAISAAVNRLTIPLGMLAIVGLWLAIDPYDAAHRSDSLREWRWTLAEPLAMLALLGLAGRERNTRTLLAAFLIAGATAAALQGVLDLAGGGLAAEGVTRISGPFPHPNSLALMLSRVVALTVAWIALSRPARPILLAPAAVTTFAVLATFSRGAMASVASAVVLLSSLVTGRARWIALTAPVVVALGAIVVASDRMLSLFSGGSGSLRLSIWRSAIEMILDRPFRGYGPDQFLYAYLPRYVEPVAWNERFSAHAHNLVLDFWVRLGIIGCAFAVGAACVCLLAAASVVRRTFKGDALAAAAVIALASAVVHGAVDNAYFSHELAMSGWLLAWLAFQLGHDAAVEGASSVARPRFWRRGFHRVASLRQPAG